MTERERFGEALLSASLKRYDAILKTSKETADCPPEHYKKMSEILGFEVAPPAKAMRLTKKKVLIALIVAALIALAGCTAYAHREKLAGFFVEITHKRITIDYGYKYSIKVTEFYMPTYIPEGLKLVYNEIDDSGICCEWKRFDDPEESRMPHNKYDNFGMVGEEHESDGKYVSYHQDSLYNGVYGIGIERCDIKVIEHNGIEMIFRTDESSYTCCWNDGKYIFVVSYGGKNISEEELFMIIDSITLVE